MLVGSKRHSIINAIRSWLDLRRLEVFIINALILCTVLLAIVVSEILLN